MRSNAVTNSPLQAWYDDIAALPPLVSSQGEVRQLRHFFGLFLALFLSSITTPRAVWCTLLTVLAYWMLIRACNPDGIADSRAHQADKAPLQLGPQDRAQRIRICSQLLQRLDYLHPVPDGCGRVNIVIVNKHLTECGLHPMLMQDPNAAVGLDETELVEQVTRGLDRMGLPASACFVHFFLSVYPDCPIRIDHVDSSGGRPVNH